MMRPHAVLALLLVCDPMEGRVSSPVPSATSENWKPTLSELSNRAALDMLSRSIRAHGGERLRQATVSFSFEGSQTLPLQNLTPDLTRNPLPRRGRIIYAAGGTRMLFEEHNTRAGVYTGRHHYVMDAGKTLDINLRAKQYRPANGNIVTQRATMFLPHVLLLDASARALTLRTAGESAISWTTATGQQVTLTIDPATGRVASAETMTAHPMFGDRSTAYHFSEYTTIEGVTLPRKRTASLSGVVTETLALSSLAVGDVAPDSFAVPEGFVLRDDAATRTRTTETVKEIGAGVFAIQNIGGTDSSVLVVLFPDFALVAGTPDAATERVLSIAGERWPRQPIRYAIPTHHHWEHAAGLRTYIANGTTIVTTPGNRELFATAANARFAIRPDALARSPRPADIEVIEGRTRAIASGGQRVVLHDLGPTSHAEEMMIVHVPGAGVVYQADLLEIDDDDPVDRFTANRVTVEFLRRLEQLELDVKMIVGAEGKIGTMEDLRQAVRLFDATMQ